MKDRECQLEAKVACYQYWCHTLNRELGKRNSAVTTHDAEGRESARDILVYTCLKCMVSPQFGISSPAGINKVFGPRGLGGGWT